MQRNAGSLPFWTALALGFVVAGCDFAPPLREVPRQATPTTACLSETASPAARSESGDTVTIASFNIQVFGASKLKKPEAMQTLAEVARRFDVLAIQEVRAKDQSVVPTFVAMVNAEGARYDYVIGPRLGRTSSKEQYAFLYNTDRIELDRGSVYTAPDPDDRLHREPLVARFRVRGPPSDEAFSFTLINIHTDPDETATELNALDEVFLAVQNNASGEDDVILLGDLNVDQHHLGQLGRLDAMAWIITEEMTNTRQTKSYDNIVFNRRSTVEYTGYHGVLNLESEFGLSREQALRVSDHFPVWATFRVRENATSATIATRPETETSPR